MKAIETEYNGILFRSRLEARWAVFFDEYGIEYVYEPEGYEVKPYEDDQTFRYLPDFYLPKPKMFVEVKGCLSKHDSEKMGFMLDWGSPMPHINDSLHSATGGLLLLGEIPDCSKGHWPLHSTVVHYKGLQKIESRFRSGGVCKRKSHWGDPIHDAYTGGDDAFFTPELRFMSPPKGYVFNEPKLFDAYRKARSARFEFGYKGVVK